MNFKKLMFPYILMFPAFISIWISNAKGQSDRVVFSANIGAGPSVGSLHGTNNPDLNFRPISKPVLNLGLNATRNDDYGVSVVFQIQQNQTKVDVPIIYLNNGEESKLTTHIHLEYAVLALMFRHFPKINFPSGIGFGAGYAWINGYQTRRTNFDPNRNFTYQNFTSLKFRETPIFMFEMGQDLFKFNRMMINAKAYFSHALESANYYVRNEDSKIFPYHYGLIINFYVMLN